MSHLGVRINDNAGSDRVVTDYCSGLKFRKTAPGGHADASCTLSLPRRTFTDLGPNDKMYVYDPRHAGTIWEGYTENPGVTAGAEGEGFDLSAQGGIVRLQDESYRLIYRDTALDNWHPSDGPGLVASPSARVEAGQFPDGSGVVAGQPGIYMQFNSGSPVGPNYFAPMVYDAFMGTNQEVGGIHGVLDGGVVDSGYSVFCNILKDDWGAYVGANVYNATLTSAATTINSFGRFTPTSPNFQSGPANKRISWFLKRTGATTNVATETIWTAFGGADLAVLGQLRDRYGNAINMTRWQYSLASEIVEDQVAQTMWRFIDPASAQIDTTSAQITQFVYIDGATPQQVLDDLALYEPNFYYGVGHTLANGLHKFWFRAWPTTPRYEVSVNDGYDAPGGEADLCNQVTVNWSDAKGVAQSTVITSTVPELGTRFRSADSITLPDGQGSLANAQTIGAAVLAQKATTAMAATAILDHPILDMQTGRLVQPWEVEPGYVVLVRETGDQLRLTEVEWDDDAGTMSLTLGTPLETVEQTVARLAKKVAA